MRDKQRKKTCQVCHSEIAKNPATYELFVMQQSVAVCDIHVDEFDDTPLDVRKREL